MDSTDVPAQAVDCHHHIFDSRFATLPGRQKAPHTVADYLLMRQALGTTRSVVVAPSTYGQDNSCLLDALATLRPGDTRGVAIVGPGASEAEVDRLHGSGVRGMRFYLGKSDFPGDGELCRLAALARDRGWNMEFVGERRAEAVPLHESLLSRLPCRVVIDHLGYAPQPRGEDSATAGSLLRLLDRGHVHVKLSAGYIQSRTPGDVTPLARALVAHAPERMLWGTDWPHTGVEGAKPTAASLLAELAEWVPDAAVRRRILVDNPADLYWRS